MWQLLSYCQFTLSPCALQDPSPKEHFVAGFRLKDWPSALGICTGLPHQNHRVSVLPVSALLAPQHVLWMVSFCSASPLSSVEACVSYASPEVQAPAWCLRWCCLHWNWVFHFVLHSLFSDISFCIFLISYIFTKLLGDLIPPCCSLTIVQGRLCPCAFYNFGPW